MDSLAVVALSANSTMLVDPLVRCLLCIAAVCALFLPIFVFS